MRRLLAFAGGILSGATVGILVALLFTPASGDEMRDDLHQRKQNALMAGRAAAAARRAELEAELASMTKSPLAGETGATLPATIRR